MVSKDEVADEAQEGFFDRFADWLSEGVGNPLAFLAALVIVLGWALAGPFSGFSTTWQLVINTVTTITTFLMVFLLSNASNRITENQERMLERIYTEQEHLDAEERLIQALLERIDRRHIRPILRQLRDLDGRLEAIAPGASQGDGGGG